MKLDVDKGYTEVYLTDKEVEEVKKSWGTDKNLKYYALFYYGDRDKRENEKGLILVDAEDNHREVAKHWCEEKYGLAEKPYYYNGVFVSWLLHKVGTLSMVDKYGILVKLCK